MIAYDHSRDRLKIFKFGRVRLGVRVLSFHNFGNLGSQLKTRYDDTLGEKWKGDLYHKRTTGRTVTTQLINCVVAVLLAVVNSDYTVTSHCVVSVPSWWLME